MTATKNDQISRYLATAPPAISGQGGDIQTFRVACALYNGFALSEEETFTWLKAYNQKCLPPWSDPRLAYKASQATKVTHQKPRGYLLESEDDEQALVPPQTPQATFFVNLGRDRHTCHRKEPTSLNVHTPDPPHAESTCTTYGKYGVETKIKDLRKPGSDKHTSGQQPTPAPQTADELARVAREVDKLAAAGAIQTTEDLAFYARLVELFGATFIGKHSDVAGPPNGHTSERIVLSHEQLVPEPPPGLSARERMKFYERDLEQTFGKEFIIADRDYQPPGVHTRSSAREKKRSPRP